MSPVIFYGFLLDLLDAFAKNDRGLVLNLLCISNIDLEKPIDEQDNTFLHSAAKSIYGRMVEMVIRYSPIHLDVNCRNVHGVTPLHVAALNNTEACSMLLQYDADVNSTTNLGYTPLQYAAQHGCYKACKLLCILQRTNFKGRQFHFINEELNINSQTCRKETALHLVIEARNGAIMQSRKRWPFNICEDRYTKIVKLLLKMGADVNIKNYAGDTPLHIAAEYEMEYIVKLLLHYNADILVTNNRNETAKNLTKNNWYPHVNNLIMVNEVYSKGG